MENIEQLKQDNAKLTERLNNAAKFFKDQKAQIDNLTKENKQLKDQIEGFENEFKSNEAYSDDLNKQIDILEAKLKEQNVKYSDLQNKLENSLATEAILRTDNDTLRKSDKENKKAYEQQKKENKETEEQFNKILNSYEKEIEDLKNKNENIESQFNEQVKTLQDALDKHIEDNKNLNNLYNDCENEKLAIQNDYYELKDKYKLLEINNVTDIDKLKNLINVLISINKKLEKNYNELKNNYSLCNEALSKAEDIIMNLNTNVNFASETAAVKNNAKNAKKENIMKSMGDRETSGQNIGV